MIREAEKRVMAAHPPSNAAIAAHRLLIIKLMRNEIQRGADNYQTQVHPGALMLGMSKALVLADKEIERSEPKVEEE